MPIEEDSLISLGRAFHNLGAANTGPFTESSLGPYIRITKQGTVVSLELLKLYLHTALGIIKKLKYEGARSL